MEASSRTENAKTAAQMGRSPRVGVVTPCGHCADVMDPSATCQVRKCPTRAAADHRSHGELVIASGRRPVEVPVHHRWSYRSRSSTYLHPSRVTGGSWIEAAGNQSRGRGV